MYRPNISSTICMDEWSYPDVAQPCGKYLEILQVIWRSVAPQPKKVEVGNFFRGQLPQHHLLHLFGCPSCPVTSGWDMGSGAFLGYPPKRTPWTLQRELRFGGLARNLPKVSYFLRFGSTSIALRLWIFFGGILPLNLRNPTLKLKESYP